MSMQGQARLTAAVGSLASVGAPVGSALPAVRMSDGLDTNAIRQGLGIEQTRFPGAHLTGGAKMRGMPGSPSASDALNLIGSVSSIASFLQGIGNDAPQESLDKGSREQQQHEEEVAKSKQCANEALNVIDQAHEHCAVAAESVVDKVLDFLKVSLLAGGHPVLAIAVKTVLGAAAKFVETLVMGRNMTVTGCLQNLCQDMEKPAAPNNSGKAICQGEQPPTESQAPACEPLRERPATTEKNDHPSACVPKVAEPPAPPQEGDTGNVHQKTVAGSQCEQPSGNGTAILEKTQPAGALSSAGEHVSTHPVKGVLPPTDDCATKASSAEAEATVDASAQGSIKKQPPVIPPLQAPGIVCSHAGLGSAQWHGFLRLVTELLCPPTDTGSHVSTPHVEPSTSEAPKHEDVVPAQSQCDEVCAKPEHVSVDCTPSEPAKPEPMDACDQAKHEPATTTCEPPKAEASQQCEPPKPGVLDQSEPPQSEPPQRCEPKPTECLEKPAEGQEGCAKEESSKDRPETDKPVPPPVNDKAPSDGYHGFDKSKHPSFPGNTPGSDPAPQLSGGTVGEALPPQPETAPESSDHSEKPAQPVPSAKAPESPPTATPAEPPTDPKPPQPQVEKPSVSPPAPHELGTGAPEGSWSPDIWVGAGISTEVQTAGSGVNLELAGAAAFGVEVERSGAW